MVTFLFLMLCPLVFEAYVLEASNVPRFLLVTVITGIVFLKWVIQGSMWRSAPARLVFMFAGYYALNLVSAGWALNTADAVYESQKIFLSLATLILFINWLHNDAEEALLVRSLIVIALLYDLYAIVEIVRLPDLNFETLYGINSFAEHKNLLASFLFLMLVFPIYGVVFFRKQWRLFSVLVLLFTFLLIIFLQTRSVYLALCFSGFICLLCLWKRLKLTRKKVMLLSTVVTVVIVLVCFIYPSVLQRFNVFHYSASASANERLKVWSNTLSLIKENPWFGVGAGNWQYTYSKFGVGTIENVSRNNISFQRPHNDLLWILSESGIVGSVLVITMIVIVFKRSVPAIRSGNINAILFFSFLSGLLVESFFSFPKERVTHIFLASVLLALLLKNTGEQRSSEVRSKTIILPLIVLLFSAAVGFCRLRGEYYTLLLLKEKEKNNPSQALHYGHKAVSVFYTSDVTSTPIYSYMGWAYSSSNRSDSLLYYNTLAYQMSPYDFEVLSNYGFALDATGDRSEARQILKEALRINPFYEPAKVNLAVVEYNSKNYQAALGYLSAIAGYETRYGFYVEKIKAKLAQSGR